MGRIQLTFTNDNVTAIAEMLEDQAPVTCQMVSKILPVSGQAHHAIFSGSEVALILPEDVPIPLENATHRVLPGEIAFTRFVGGAMYSVPETFSELCWFYDRDATPSMPDGPVPVNIFARIIEGADAFNAVCLRMRREGIMPITISLEPQR